MNRVAAAPARALPAWLSLATRTATCVAARAPQSARRWAAPASPAGSMRTVSTGVFSGVPRGAAAAVASVGGLRLQFGVGSFSGGIAGAQQARGKVTAKKKQEKEDSLVFLTGELRLGPHNRTELKELRARKMVPGRIQNKGGPKKAVYVAMDLGPLLRAAQYRTLLNRLWQVCLPGREPMTCIIREMQTHHTNEDDLVHVNFVQYIPGEPRIVEVPFEVTPQHPLP
ncbi:hypothetical protein T484DRAFT_3127457 [Baffinella frigidus]|nr:hypothetical protein T484DRAFT_3127457 [Cryptophyta sp. CCMP2293]